MVKFVSQIDIFFQWPYDVLSVAINTMFKSTTGPLSRKIEIWPKPKRNSQTMRRYARGWRNLTLHIINVEKNVSRLLFHFFFFLICVCIPWVWLRWRWFGCVLMYCSLFQNFTFCFYCFLFYFGLLVYIRVVGVFL